MWYDEDPKCIFIQWHYIFYSYYTMADCTKKPDSAVNALILETRSKSLNKHLLTERFIISTNTWEATQNNLCINYYIEKK